MLARWGDGIKDAALRQFASVSPDKHDALTLEVMAEGSRLRHVIDSCSEMGALADVEFARSIAQLRSIPFDDSKCEGPHARAGQVGSSSRRAKWPWIASSVRLDQHVNDFEQEHHTHLWLLVVGRITSRCCRSTPSTRRGTRGWGGSRQCRSSTGYPQALDLQDMSRTCEAETLKVAWAVGVAMFGLVGLG